MIDPFGHKRGHKGDRYKASQPSQTHADRSPSLGCRKSFGRGDEGHEKQCHALTERDVAQHVSPEMSCVHFSSPFVLPLRLDVKIEPPKKAPATDIITKFA